MTERIKLIEEQAETRAHLIEMREDLKTHSQLEHPINPTEGAIPQTCHRCMNIRLGMRTDEFNLWEIEHELQELDKG